MIVSCQLLKLLQQKKIGLVFMSRVLKIHFDFCNIVLLTKNYLPDAEEEFELALEVDIIKLEKDPSSTIVVGLQWLISVTTCFGRVTQRRSESRALVIFTSPLPKVAAFSASVSLFQDTINVLQDNN